MAETLQNVPILYGLDGAGNLRHIDDVENGEACGCVCPDPTCAQPLIAKNAGEKRIHHFAHKRGSCAWSAEYVISMVAREVISSRGCMYFPELTYFDYVRRDDAVLASGRTLGVSAVDLAEVSGRGNPDLVVRCGREDGERSFLVTLGLVHGLSEPQERSIDESGMDAVYVDLKKLADIRKVELGKHFDREGLLADFQRPVTLAEILCSEDPLCMRWLFNAKGRDAEVASRRRRDEILEERRKKEELERAERQKTLDEARRLQEEKRAAQARADEEEGKRRASFWFRIREAGEKRRERAEAARTMELERRKKEEQERARREEEQKRIEAAYMLAVIDSDPDTPLIDAFGRRWVRCERCGRTMTDDNFVSYGGRGRARLGTCKACSET